MNSKTLVSIVTRFEKFEEREKGRLSLASKTLQNVGEGDGKEREKTRRKQKC